MSRKDSWVVKVSSDATDPKHFRVLATGLPTVAAAVEIALGDITVSEQADRHDITQLSRKVPAAGLTIFQFACSRNGTRIVYTAQIVNGHRYRPAKVD